MERNKLIGVELSHETTMVDTRERFMMEVISPEMNYHQLKNSYSEVFIIATCNRFAVYVYGSDAGPLIDFFLDKGAHLQQLIIKNNTSDTLKYLFETVSGIRSQVLGDQQLLGQFRLCYDTALKYKALGPVLNELVRYTIKVGKRVRTETDISRYSSSLAGAAFDIVNKKINNPSACNAIIIGTGKMGALATSVFLNKGFKKLFIASHDFERAKKLTEKSGGIPVCIKDIPFLINKARVVIGCTHTEVNLLGNEPDSKCPRNSIVVHKGQKKLFIDLGMPRNFNSHLRKVPGVELFDLDDIKILTDANVKLKSAEIPKIELLIEEEISNYLRILEVRELAPLLGNYWNKMESVKRDRLAWLIPKIGNMNEDQKRLIERFAHHIIRDLSRDFLKNIRYEKNGASREEIIRSFEQLYAKQIN